jgi:hypothetical protein
MRHTVTVPIKAITQLAKHLLYLRMFDGLVGRVRKEILLRHVSDVVTVGIFGEEMIEGLVLAWTQLFRNGLVPVFRVGEFRIDVEDDAPKGEDPVLHHLADAILGESVRHGVVLVIVAMPYGRNSFGPS